MNCERAEDFLSAFLDNALDSRLSQQVRAHVEDCAHCRAILDDYRSFDHLLATSARIEPPEALHARIFDSDEYRAILAAREAGIDLAAEADAFDTPNLLDLPDDLPVDPDELLPPQLADLPEMRPPMGGPGVAAEAPPGVSLFERLGSSVWPKALLPVAAVLALTFGAALLMKQGLFPFSAQTTSGVTTTLGNPGQQGIPLAAGPRVVYLHDGILWSAPENGPGIAAPLTASGVSGVTVGAWSVSPTGQFVAYVDIRTSKLHIVRSDGLNDHVIASTVAGGIVWSPDGARVAYLAAASGSHVVHVVDADGTNDVTIGATGADAASVAWSGDSAWIAYTEAHAGVTAVWSYDLTNNVTHTLTPRADTGDAQATVSQLAWLPDMSHPSVTWATSGANGAIEGVYSASAYGGSTRQLTPAGARYTAAAYTSARSGQWLLGDGNVLSLTTSSGPIGAVTLDAPASHIVWSPSGVAAVTYGDALALWSPSGFVTVDTGVVGIAPVWSADGLSLLYAKADGVQLARISASSHITVTPVLQATKVGVVGWSPDAHSVVVVTAAGVLLIAPDGSHAKLVDHHTPDGGALVWSVAG